MTTAKRLLNRYTWNPTLIAIAHIWALDIKCQYIGVDKFYTFEFEDGSRIRTKSHHGLNGHHTESILQGA